LISSGIGLESITTRRRRRRKEYSKRAKEMGLTYSEYVLLNYAYWVAELSSKPDETVEQTQVRANEIWQKEVQSQRENEQRLIDSIMSLPENERKEFVNKMRE
jgi:hypothetical protein